MAFSCGFLLWLCHHDFGYDAGMTIQEFQATKIEGAAYWLSYFIANTPAEKQDWTPSIEGSAKLRTMLDFAAECITVNELLTQILRGETPNRPANIFEAPRPFTTTEEAGIRLEKSAKEFADAIRAMSDVDLSKMYKTHRGEVPGLTVIEIPYRNMIYHTGQVNLYQLQYGDTEFNFPPPKK